MSIPILRLGTPYESVDKVTLVHHATGEPVATVSQANSGMIPRDVHRMRDDVLDDFTVSDLIGLCKKAAELFRGETLPLGDTNQSFDNYVHQLSATTGMPITYCRNNADKIYKVLSEMDVVIAGLTRGFDLSILDQGYGGHGGGMLSYYRVGRTFGAVLPSNSPGVHSLWLPAVALKIPLVLKPGREEPWTPYRVIQSLIAAGVPREAFGFYPTDHGGAAELLRVTSRSMLFGDASTTKPWKNDPRVQLHGPGFSKVILGEDAAENWPHYVDLMVSSISANGGRSCLNASGVWTPRHGRAIAEALAEQLAKIQVLPADDPRATLAAFATSSVAERISAVIDQGLREPGAVDLTTEVRGGSRLVTLGRCAYLLPTIIWCDGPDHTLANREFLFPIASVVECPTADMSNQIGPTLVASAVTSDRALIDLLMSSPHVDRLNIGAIPTMQIGWDQPHEGNLFEHLYRQRAFQIVSA
ncbi:MAG: aldehyde dehydrogenase family protein [Planctomycetota bacterium]